ncbi:MAG: DUF4430 domain-containing protein [Pirellulales bacterium]|nr:DUF4430 domain-containing protein [Pirellulales bacterium]
MLYLMAADPSRTDAALVGGAVCGVDAERWWALPLMLALLVGVVAAIGFWTAGGQFPNTIRPDAEADRAPIVLSPSPQGASASLAIDFGNGARREFAALPWRPQMTVADLMEAAREFRPGIVYEQQGTGAGAFLTALEGVAGEGAGGRWWQYLVNGRPANDSFGVHQLNAGDRVLWRFAAGDEQDALATE